MTKATCRRKARPHWYRLHAGECPACGRDASFRERVYGRRPRRPERRHAQLPETHTYCGCLDRQ